MPSRTMAERTEAESSSNRGVPRVPAGRTLVERLSVQSFRNLKQVQISPAAQLNLVFGDNGHGKTSLIEALYVACTTKSFRTTKLGETIRENDERSEVRAQVRSQGLTRTLRCQLSPRGRSFQLDGKRPKRFVDYARATPVIAFHPGDLGLAHGPATGRRSLLDRLLVHEDATAADARLSYQRAVRERQRVLADRGPRARELDAFEPLVAQYGARLQAGRQRVAERLAGHLLPAFQRMAAPGLDPQVRFRPGGTTDQEEFLRQLVARRVRDVARGAATFGPHRDELELIVAGRPARTHASQGQQRVLTLALKFAELSCVREVTEAEPLLLLDDVSSELDPERTAAVFDFLAESRSQMFVTTTRRDLFSEVLADSSERVDFRLVEGELQVCE